MSMETLDDYVQMYFSLSVDDDAKREKLVNKISLIPLLEFYNDKVGYTWFDQSQGSYLTNRLNVKKS